MKIGFIGLGRMGCNMVENLLDRRHKVVAYNRSSAPTKKIAKLGATPAFEIKELVGKLPSQKIIWIMIKSGKPVDQVISSLILHLKKDDIIIDGGNSFYRDSIRRYKELKKLGIGFLDCGTSGGISGARHGACMMIGGEKKVFNKVETLFKDMCVRDGYGYMGKSGAGHFVKMVHNGVEYGMMGAIAEGFNAVKNKQKQFGTDLKEVAKVYSNGSIVESNLMKWLWDSFQKKGYLSSIFGSVPKGETEDEMKFLEKLSGMKVLNQARLMRVRTRLRPSFVGQMIAAMRNQFGGHKVFKK